jgi:hypothetical protein
MGQPAGAMGGGGGMAPRPASPMGGGMSSSPSAQPYRPSWASDDEKDEL